VHFQVALDFVCFHSVSYTRGKHLFKFGVELRTTHGYGFTIKNGEGTLGFGGVSAFSGATPLEDFLAGLPSKASVLVGDPDRNFVYDAYAVYAQDDWRLTPRLTANLGLRYEYIPALSVPNGQLGNFDPTSPTGLVQVGIQTKQIFDSDKKKFAPRIGLAWDVDGKGTTVVRAGASIIFASYNIQDFANDVQLNVIPTGFTLIEPNGSALPSPGNIANGTVSLTSGIPWALNTPVFNTTASALKCGNGLAATSPGTGKNPSPCSIGAVNPNLAFPYVSTWTLSVQHAFTNNLSLEIAYVGNHGTKLADLIDVNAATPGAPNTKANGFIEQARRPYNNQFPYLSTINYYSNIAHSNYDGLQATLTERVSRGLSFTAAYTLSHALDVQSEQGGSMNPPLENANPGLDYGNSEFDARNRLTLMASYNIPGRKSPGQLLEGWQINSSVNLISAFPWNAVDTTSDLSGTGDLQDRWDLVGRPQDFQSGGAGAIPCFGFGGGTVTINGTPTVFPASSFAKTSNCVAALPVACISAATAQSSGPGGTSPLTSLYNMGCYMMGSSVIVPPAQGAFGTMARNALRGKGFRQWDLSTTKEWKFKEEFTLQFRAEFFNILNRTQYYSPNGTPNANPSAPGAFGESPSTTDVGQNNPVTGTGGPRAIQFGLKLIF
jgi:hypothetical protein